MIIESYEVMASSQRTSLTVQSTRLTAKRETGAASGVLARPEENSRDNVTISDAVKDMYKQQKEDSHRYLAQKANAPSVTKTRNGQKTPMTPEQLKITLIEMMIEMMTGKKVKLKVFTPEEYEETPRDITMPGLQSGATAVPMQITDRFEFESFHYESERVSYQAQGLIKTADGRTIGVDINMYMSREFVSYTSVSMQMERPCDPLVINYGGTAASLTGEKFDFDLTMNGLPDRISLLGEGSGFLAIDRNGDGIINDGSELFGPRTGNGFAELRAYDQDGNGWIDEADDIFSKLLVWTRDRYGNDQFFTLKELGIGAIFLGDISTEFSYKDDSNQTLGIMRSTSFFLNEYGGAGTVSHVDMMI